MKYLLIISCFLFTSISWSKDVDWGDLVQRDGLYYEKYIDVPFSGEVISDSRDYDTSGTYIEKNGELIELSSPGIIVKIQGKIRKGKIEGQWLEYHQNGQLWIKKNYKDGKQEGKWTEYHSNGQLWFKSNYTEGKKEGQWLQYYNDGELRDKGNYRKGKREGEWLNYNHKGQLQYEEYYKDGKVHGESFFYTYYENGQLKETNIYKDGKYSKLIKTITHENTTPKN